MTKIGIRRALLIVLLAVAALVIFLVATTPSGNAHQRDPNQVTRWVTHTESIDKNAIRRWVTHRIRRQAIVHLADGSIQDCTHATVTVTGQNFLFHDLMWGTTWAHWCYTWPGHALINSTVNFDHGGGAAGWTLWGRDAANDSETGPNFGYSQSHNTGYAYDRYYFSFARGLTGPLSQHVYPWVSMTIRGDGTCTADKFTVDGTLSC